MIKCYLCPLNDVCPIPRIELTKRGPNSHDNVFTQAFTKAVTVSPELPPLKFNWLSDGAEGSCPLYKVADFTKIISK